MAALLRFAWPSAIFYIAIGAALVSLGADDPVASLALSTLIIGFAALSVATGAVTLPRYAIGVVAFLAALAGLAWVRSWIATGAPEYASLVASFALFFVARSVGRRHDQARFGWDAILALGVIVGVASYFDTILDPARVFGMERQDWSDRLSTPFLSPNTAGTFFGLLALLAVARIVDGLEQRRRSVLAATILPAAAAIIAIICLLMTGSRGALLAFAPAALGFGVWAATQSRMRGVGAPLRVSWPALAGIGLLACAAGVWVAGDLLMDRFSGGLAGAGGLARGEMFEAYIAAIGLAPIFGHGLGGFTFVNAMVADAMNARTLMFQNAAHSVYLQWLLQGGVAGFAAMAIIVFVIARELVQGLRRRRTQRALIAAGLVGGVFVGLHGAVDFALEIPGFLWIFAWSMGLSAGVASGGSRPRRDLGRRWGAAISCLLLAALGLSIYATWDRLEARRASEMSAASLQSLSLDTSNLEGSADRLVAVGDAALEQGLYALSREAFERAVEAEPRDGVVWAKLSYARLLHEPWGAEAIIEALRQSYYLSPYLDERFRGWRHRYALEIYPILPADLQAAVDREMVPFRP